MKPKTILIVLLVALAISGVVLYFLKKAADAKKAALQADAPIGAGNATSLPPTATGKPAVAPVTNSDYPIVYNKYSYSAKPLQAALNVTQDGIIGPKTLAALAKYWQGATQYFKIDNKIQRDAIVATIKAAKQQEAYLGN
jgi:murein L,D-transpeptidase YcbB/YkuD